MSYEEFKPSDRLWGWMCDHDVPMPVPLAQLDIDRPFIYCRKYGVFQAPHYHEALMAMLYAHEQGVESYLHLPPKLMKPSRAAEKWMETMAGAAIGSSVSRNVQVWTNRGLTPEERRAFGKVYEMAAHA